MAIFTGSITGIAAVQAQLNLTEEKIYAAAFLGVQRGVLQGQSIVRGNARGRPGPRAPTGDFNRTILGDSERQGSRLFGQVGTNADQARRLELGFTGRDSLDREYDQPPYAYMQPSVPEVRTAFVGEVEAAVGRAFG